MKVVFFEDVEGTAQVGDVKQVKNGFARNYLLPRNLAGPTTPDNLQHANSLAEKEARRQAKRDEEASVHKERLDGYVITIEARVGETGRLYGSVTNRDIAARITEATGLEVDSHIILLPEPIRDLGQRAVSIKFTRNVIAEVIVDVVPDEESKPVVEQLEAQRAAEEAEEQKAAEAAAYARAQAAEESEEDTGDEEAAEDTDEEAAEG